MLTRNQRPGLECITQAKPTLARKTAWSAAASLSSALTRMLAGVIIARMLGPVGTGEIAYHLWVCDMAGVVMAFGIPNTMTRYAAEMVARGELAQSRALLRSLFLVFSGLMTIGALSILALTNWREESKAISLAVSAVFFTQALSTVYFASLAGYQRFDKSARITLYTSITTLVALALLTLYFGIVGALCAYAIGSALPAILSTSLLSRKEAIKPEDPHQRWRPLATYSLNAWFAAVVSAIVWSRAEVYFLERYCDSAAVASFTVAISISLIATQVPLLLGSALFPHFSELSGMGDRSAIARTYAVGTRLIALLLFPLCLGCAAITPVLLPTLYGSNFDSAVPCAIVLSAWGILGAATVGSSLLYGLGHARFVAVFGLVGAVVLVLLSKSVIPVWGAWGAVWVRVSVQACMIGITLIYIGKYLHIPVPWVELCKTLIAALVCAACALCSLSLYPTAYMLPISVLLGAVGYIIAVRYLRVLHPDDKDRIAGLLGDIERRTRLNMKPILHWLFP